MRHRAHDDGATGLRAMIAAVRASHAEGMSEAEADEILERVLHRARAADARGHRARLTWMAGMAAALVLLAVIGPVTPPAGGRVARETVIRIEADGREVFVRAVAYEED